MNRFIAAALGGLVATVPMTIAMAGLWKKLSKKDQYPAPPREITEETAHKFSRQAVYMSDKQMAKLSLSAHFAYGAAAGALYPVFCREPLHPLIFGAGYGVSIWAASYLGWIPAARILKPATQHPAARNQAMIASHLVWGAATVLIGERLRRFTLAKRHPSTKMGEKIANT